MYSQNNEDEIVAGYFGNFKGYVLDIGANDGITFSNSRKLIMKGWSGCMVEPSEYGYNKLLELYNYGTDKVMVCHCAISIEDGLGYLLESGAHVPNGKDKALVSTLHQSEAKRWASVDFSEKVVTINTFKTFLKGNYNNGIFDFITIDAEGEDWNILQQIDLTAVGCKCLCIEWNGRRDLERLFTAYCEKHKMTEIHRNSENLLFAV